MKHSVKYLAIFIAAISVILITACSSSSGVSGSKDSSPTATPTSLVLGKPQDEIPPQNPCEGVTGSVEMQILVGPAEVAGLEPVAVGSLPFKVLPGDGGHLVQGGGNLTYQDVLQEEWGTYTVYFDMDAEIEGECIPQGVGQLVLVVNATGEQLLEVRAEGFSGDYPWSGTQQLNLEFPLENGAQSEGEGWSFTLSLDK